MGGTDCAQPMIHAKQKKLKVDVFIVYTDCETWAGTHTHTHTEREIISLTNHYPLT